MFRVRATILRRAQQRDEEECTVMAKDAQQMPVRIKFRTDASLSHDEFSDGCGCACERGGTIGQLEPDAAWGAN